MNTRHADTRLVSFDIWSTLLQNNNEFRQAQFELIREAISYNGEPSGLRVLIKRVEAELDYETEQFGHQFGLDEHIARLVQVADLPSLSTDQLEALRANLDEARLTNTPQLTESGLPEIFAELKGRGMQLAVICNTSTTAGSVVHKVLAQHGLARYLDYAIYSDEVGFSKPDPRIFAELVDRSGIAPEHITHVGDNPITDVQGAIDAKFEAVLYDRQRQHPESSSVIWSHSSLPALLTEEKRPCVSRTLSFSPS